MLPYKTFTKINGINAQVAQRGFAESEVLGLKIAQLLLPINTHKIGALRDIRARYDQSAPLVNENHFATLGIIGSIGFILLLLMLLNINNKSSIQNRLAMLNIIAVLYATVGGLSVLFALIISPSIRGHNRISIFIATFSLIAVALFLQYLFKKYQLSKVSIFFVSMFIMLIGLYDQIPGGATFKTNSLIESTFNSDKKFIQQIEDKLKRYSSNMVMQYPHMSYPEQPVLVKMLNYSHMVGYLHSNNIHWSYGAVTGREGDIWLKSLEALDIKEQIKVLQKGGFTGIYIDRRGYIDNANMLESKLKEILNIEPIISEDKNKSFFDIVPTDHTIMKFSGFEKNFYGWESNQFGSFGWTSGSAILLLQNNRANNLNCNLAFNVGTLKNRNLKIMFNDKLLRDFFLQPGLNKTVLLEELRLNPGSNRLSFITDTPGAQPGNGDPRSLAYSIEKMKIICGGISVGNLIE
ncbi:hypothetical protein [Sulfurospirillum diekertiae]|uniref:Uncharacterized protein n=2 Tax=Sulfurospirillum diekertiae TaxID=1854492 RepID=A0AA92FGI9_9BACT|nr:hypothetical protein [Sulfurospirillum diekertiae]QIR75441.1 hypothetical protein FA584_04175 [Sulfurospirillum diekertiae]